MSTTELLANWSMLSWEEIADRLEQGEDEAIAQELFGADEVSAMQAMAMEPSENGLRQAVVLLPGIMGSLLSSIRGVTELLWINPAIFLKGQSSLLELNLEGSGDLHPEVDAVPVGLEKLTYTKIGIALSRKVDLYEFPYDWRRPIAWNARLLHDYIERWAQGQKERQFTLVGHSMGGLVARAYLALHRTQAEVRVNRVVMQGTPHYGAAGTIEDLVFGNRMMAIAKALNGDNAPLRLLRNLPSVYEILPSPPDLFEPSRPYPANWDLYHAAAWRLDGIRQDYLDKGWEFHELLAATEPQIPLYQIAGCNLETIVEVRRTFGPDGEPEYDLVCQHEGADSGDGTVPLWSAVLPGAQMYYIQVKHRDLVKNKAVIEGTLDLIHGGIPDLPTVIPPRKPSPFSLAATVPLDVEADRLRESLEGGNPSSEELSKLYFAF